MIRTQIMLTHPYAELSMEGTKQSQLLEKYGGYIRHKYLWVMNGEGISVGHPVGVRSEVVVGCRWGRNNGEEANG
jgi:hypothetical protein